MITGDNTKIKIQFFSKQFFAVYLLALLKIAVLAPLFHLQTNKFIYCLGWPKANNGSRQQL
jgi:hypothetical protein